MSIAVFLIVKMDFNWEGRATSIVTSSFLFAVVAIIILLNHNMLQFSFDKEKMVHALKYGSGLIPHAIGAIIMTMSNRLFLNNMIGVDEVGLYGVAFQFASIMGFITLSFNNAFVPWLFKKLSLNSYAENLRVVKLSYVMMILYAIIVVALYAVIILIFPFFVHHKFHDALLFIPFLLLGSMFQGFYFLVTNYIAYSEKTYYLAYSTSIVAIFSIIANYVCINMMGAVGAAATYAISYALYFLLTWFMANKVYPMPWALNKVKI